MGEKGEPRDHEHGGEGIWGRAGEAGRVVVVVGEGGGGIIEV